MKYSMLTSDLLLYVLIIMMTLFAIFVVQQQQLRLQWHKVLTNPFALSAMVILLGYLFIALLDSIHFQKALPVTSTGEIHYSATLTSLLDMLLSPLDSQFEKTYSAPMATHLYQLETIRQNDGTILRYYPKLAHISPAVLAGTITFHQDITQRILFAVVEAMIIWLVFSALLISWLAYMNGQNYRNYIKMVLKGQTPISWRSFLITMACLILSISLILHFIYSYHLFGTDKVGRDIFYEAIKSIRTGVLIGTLTALIMLPFAILFGTMAGYFGGFIDDIIQYIYTVLSSIPGVLLIAAAILSIQIYIANHPDQFATMASRADVRLIALCTILGITSWTSLCRVLRAETLKIRELDYMMAAKSLGVKWYRIIMRHILPNVMHIILITTVLDFSALVLAEAVLTYVGVGVDPTMMSWGNMIDSARLELARDPVVWWPLLAAFIFMFTFVLAANLFADAIRDAFDPRTLV